MSKQSQVLLPDIGDFSDVEVTEILVAPGDRVEAETSLLTLESDKASMEIPSPQAGVVESIAVKIGDKLNQGDLILQLQVEQAPQQEPQPPQQAAAEQAESETESKPDPSTGAASQVEVTLPDIGDFKDVEVIEILAQPGDQVEKDASLVTLESDKASMEVPAPFSGKLLEYRIKLGDRLNQGDIIALFEVSELDDLPAAELQPEAEPAGQSESEPDTEQTARPAGEQQRRRPPVMPTPNDMQAIARGRKAHAGPAVRRFARELGVELAQVSGSGPKGRVLKEDVQNFVKKALGGEARAPAASGGAFALPPLPQVDFSKFGGIEIKPLSRIKKLSGGHLHNCWLNIPHVTQFDEADISELEAFRQGLKAEAEQRGLKLTLFPFLLKACAAALRALPEFNSSLSPEGDSLVLKKYVHIGVAVDTPNGLLVPVLRDVEQKSLFDLAAELMQLSAKAREGKLLPGDLQGGCFSISSLGGIGGTAFTPIVNAPEVAILGVSRAAMKPVWNGSEFAPRLMLPLSLSYDHRVIDGAQGARFTSLLTSLLGDIRRLLL
ncbi:dihydrolipoyllysine-residue acetyltransferase [Magnetovirga frankeli]|uniref:dihydrolipoyllysine-residue acetyltransferase n=1 Tax=Magnetovirga frankeli TaxID=947516 RepID=UPI001292FD66|nr:dihydrolipoyllysine-residue acetyltransferase [gamma proteobacterium SS-5]